MNTFAVGELSSNEAVSAVRLMQLRDYIVPCDSEGNASPEDINAVSSRRDADMAQAVALDLEAARRYEHRSVFVSDAVIVLIIALSAIAALV